MPYANKVKETTTTSGTGTLTLNGAVSDARSFGSVFGDGTTLTFCVDDGAGNWEISTGVIGGSGTTLTRDIVEDSSNAGSLVSFSTGGKIVFLSQVANRVVDQGLAFIFSRDIVWP